MKTGKPRTEDRRRRERLARREKRAGDMLPYARHIDATTIATRDGQQMQVIHVAGFSFETADTQELNYRKNIRDTLLRGIASGDIDINISTHALLTESVKFESLAITEKDEQQRNKEH